MPPLLTTIICAVHRVELHRVQPLLPYFLSLYRNQLLFHFAGAASYAMTAIVALGMAGVVCGLADERTSTSSSCLGSPSGKLHHTTAVTFRVTNRFSCSCVGPHLFIFSPEEDHLVGYITRRGIQGCKEHCCLLLFYELVDRYFYPPSQVKRLSSEESGAITMLGLQPAHRCLVQRPSQVDGTLVLGDTWRSRFTSL